MMWEESQGALSAWSEYLGVSGGAHSYDKIQPDMKSYSIPSDDIRYSHVLDYGRSGRTEGNFRGRYVCRSKLVLVLAHQHLVEKIGREDAERDYYSKLLPAIRVSSNACCYDPVI